MLNFISLSTEKFGALIVNVNSIVFIRKSRTGECIVTLSEPVEESKELKILDSLETVQKVLKEYICAVKD